MLHAAVPAHQMRPGDIEQVVAADTHPHGFGALGSQDPIHHALVVGIDLRLGAIGRRRPAVNRRVHSLHRQIGSFRQAYLYLASPGGAPVAGPPHQFAEGGKGVRKVSLQDYPGGLGAEFRLRQDGFEGRQGEFQIVVLLHVQVDEHRGEEAEALRNSNRSRSLTRSRLPSQSQ